MIAIYVEKYLRMKWNPPIPPEIFKALAISIKAGLEETISCPDQLARYNKELPIEIFKEVGALKIEVRDIKKGNYILKEEYVDLSNLEGFQRSDRIIWM